MTGKTGKVFSLILIIVGILLLASPYIPPLATILYPEKFWYSLYPDGTTTSNPTMLTPESTIQLKCQLVYYDIQTGVSLPGTYFTWTVQVTIVETGETITLVDKGYDTTVAPVEDRYATYLFDQNHWVVPSTGGATYTFNWLVILRDDSQVEYGRQTKTTYARTVLEEPDGYFTINGAKADEQTTHLVLEPLVAMAFIPTKNAEQITSVYVEIWKGTSKITTYTLSKSGLQYVGSYTLPGYGTYKFKGFYTWTGSTTPIQKMSVVVSMESGYVYLPLTYPQIVGVIFITAGGVLLAVFLTRKET